MRSFNTSGPNNLKQHYTLFREDLVQQGMQLVEQERYFTVWAPRQTGKSTYFMLLKNQLEKLGYRVAKINMEDLSHAAFPTIRKRFQIVFAEAGIQLEPIENFGDLANFIHGLDLEKLVLIVDEIEGLNPEYLGQFLHAIRQLFHSREQHCLKSVLLVGVSNIFGVTEANASPFNITDTLNIPYFSDEETAALLSQHQQETGQVFDHKVVEELTRITANQPGLVNGFAQQLILRTQGKPSIKMEDYNQVEDWYLHKAIDKNFANILKHAKLHREFVEKLLFRELEVPFEIDRESIKGLHVNGLIRWNERNMVEFWVPFYKKRLQSALYPYTNGEREELSSSLFAPDFFNAQGKLALKKLIDAYKSYVKRRGFGVFREKSEDGRYTSIKEAGLIYSFETFIAAFLLQAEGKSYREANAGLGKSDLILNVNKQEILFESKKYYGFTQFENGKKQLAYYAVSLGLNEAVYLVFTPSHLNYPAPVVEQEEVLNGITIHTFLIEYDEEKDF
jgi:hypothetical protein